MRDQFVDDGDDRCTHEPVDDGPAWIVRILEGQEGEDPARFLELVLEAGPRPPLLGSLTDVLSDLWDLWKATPAYSERCLLIDSDADRCLALLELERPGLTKKGDRRRVRRTLARLMEFLLRETANKRCSLPITRAILSRSRLRTRQEAKGQMRANDGDERRFEFMQRRVRRGKAFSTEHIVKTLGVTRRQAERRKHNGLFTHAEIAALLGLSIEATRSLWTPTVSVTALNALATYAGYLDPRLREVIALSKGTWRGAAANESGLVSEVDLSKLNLKAYFADLQTKYDRLRS